MVRHYKRKTSDSYSYESLLKAVEMVKKQQMSTYKAAEVFGVPRATIQARVNGKRGMKQEHRGRPTTFASAFESNIVRVLHTMERCGFGLTKREVIGLVGQYVSRNNIETPFKGNIPGDDWFVAFIRRNKLSLKKPRAVEIARKKAADPFIVQEFYDLLEETIIQLDIPPSRIFNLDETSFNIDPSKSKIVGVQGYSCTRTTSTSGRENITVLLAANACGEKIPPLIIFKGTYLWNSWLYESDRGDKTTHAATRKGWMEATVFESYFENVIIPTLCEKNEPLLIIYDGHSTHLDINVLEKAAAHNITIIKLPPHTSHILQPLDISTMKSMKDRWEKQLVQWQRKNIGKKLPKSEFSRIMTQVWNELEPVILINGFKKAGIWPVDRNQISEDKLDQLALARWKRVNTNDINNENTMNQNENNGECNEEEETNKSLLTNMENNTDINTIEEEVEILKDQIEMEIKDGLTTDKQNIEVTEYGTDLKELSDNNYLIQEKSFIKEKERNFHTSVVRNPKTFKLNLPKNFTSKEHCKEKLQILKNEIIAKPQNNSTHPVNTSTLETRKQTKANETEEQPSINVTFEALVLQTISQGSQNKVAKKKRIGKGAEVITQKEAMERIKQERMIKLEKGKGKEKKSTSTTTDKGKRASSKKENRKPNKKSKKNSKKTKNNNESDTSNSDIQFSIHSDSDIFDLQSRDVSPLLYNDLHMSCLDEDNNNLEDKRQVLTPTLHNSNTHNDTTLLENLPQRLKRTLRTENKPIFASDSIFYSGSRDINKLFNNQLDVPHGEDTAVAGCSKDIYESTLEYNVDDTVLVRYVTKKVDYYVGVVVEKLKDSTYKISYYTKIGKNDSVRFKKKKVKEIGIVDSDAIVKTVELLATNQNETEFVFRDEDDYCYFDY